MLGTLTKEQSLHILRSQVVGRLGCYAEGEMYVVPVTYVCDGGYLYAHSRFGKKIEMMRKNPKVCFQVDEIENMASWRSVIVWGKFEEMKASANEQKALKILRDRLMPMTTSATVKPPSQTDMREVTKALKAVTYRIAIKEITGRYEKLTAA